MTGVYFVGGLICLLAGAQLLVSSSSSLAVRFGVPSIFIGVTVIAFATSAPEVAVSLDAILTNKSSLVLGNVLGSNIANVLLILGISSLLSPIAIQQRLIWLDIPIMILASVVVYLLSLDQSLGAMDGGILLLLFAGFMVFQVLQAKKESKEKIDELQVPKSLPVQIFLLLVGLSLLVLGAHWLVQSAIEIARFWGLSELVIGLTIVAIGTSLPEIATSVFAAWNKEADLSVGNVIGSNIFNILLVLGITALFSSNGIEVTTASLALDFPFMVAVSIACLPIFFTGHKISRWEGGLFLGYYGFYLAYLFLDSTQHEILPLFNFVMVLLVAPLTAVTLTVLAYRYYKYL